MAKCYKVLYEDKEGNLYSAVWYKIFPLSYAIRKKTTASIGGCLCFETFEKALDFIDALARPSSQNGNYKIFEAEGTGLIALGTCLTYDLCTGRADIVKAWDAPITGKYWPDGTIAYKEVELLAEVK